MVSIYYSIPLRDSFRGPSSRKPELLIARTQGRDQFRHFVVTFQATEAFDSFEDAGGDPAYHHLPVAPALDVPLHRTGATDETLCSIGRAQRSTQRRRQTKTDDRQRFIESFTQTFGGAGMIGLELARQALQLPFGDRDIVAVIGALQLRLHPRALALR